MTTGIEWADESWNPITGCKIKSPGCRNCYAMKLAAGRLRNHPAYRGTAKIEKGQAVWTGRVGWNPKALDLPRKAKRPRLFFVNSMGDLFFERVSRPRLDRVFDVIDETPRHVFVILTKRPDRMADYLDLRYGSQGPAQLWVGTSVEDQARAQERLLHLRSMPAGGRLVSVEPMQGFVDLSEWLGWLDWVVAGGESGERARPIHPEAVRGLRDACARADVAFFWKQWGEFIPADQGLVKGPEDYRWQEFLDMRNGRHRDPFAAGQRNDELGYTGASGFSVFRVGKKFAGASIDGALHRAFPAAIAAQLGGS